MENQADPKNFKDKVKEIALDVLKIFQRSKQDIKNKDEDSYIPTETEVYKFIIKHLKIESWLVIALFASWILKIFSSSLSIYSQYVVVNMRSDFIDNNWDSLKLQMFYYLIVQCIIIFQQLLGTRLYQYTQQSLQEKIQTQVMEHILSLDISFFEENKSTQLIELIQFGSQDFVDQLRYNTYIQRLNNYMSSFSSIYFIYTLSPSIMVTMVLISFVFFVINKYLQLKRDEEQKKQNKQQQFQTFALSDMLNNIFVIKSFGTEKREIDILHSLQKSNEKNTQKSLQNMMVRNMFSSSGHDITTIAIILQTVYLKSTENFSYLCRNISELIYHIFYIGFTFEIILYLIKQEEDTYHNIQMERMGKIMKIFEQKASIPQEINNQEKQEPLQGNISFQNVSFQYPKINDKLAKLYQELHEENRKEKQAANNLKESDKSEDSSHSSDSELLQEKETTNTKEAKSQVRQQAIDNLSFEIKSGQFVSFVGKSGSGKSTIGKLLQRVYDPNSGDIFYDGQNGKEKSVRQIKSSIGYVSQEPTLLDNDIEFNITYGCPEDEYSQEDVKKACDISGVSEFVFDKKRFPKGLKTLIGANGIKLSGGQKQRVAIARALLKKPSILILDEATSSLDAESEYTVQKYIDEIIESENRTLTIVVIAHRLSTIIKSDTIFVMDQGQLKESGNHNTLIQKDGIYKKLVSRQMTKLDENQQRS